MAVNSKTVIEMPLEEFQYFRDTNQKILTALEAIKVITPDEYITRRDFMAKTGIGRTKFTELVNKGKLNVKHVGKKKYVISTDVQRFFRGELQ